MIRDKCTGRVMALALALVVLLAASGNAQQPPKATKPAKSSGKDNPPPVQMTLEPKAIEDTEGRMQSPGRCPHHEFHGGGYL